MNPSVSVVIPTFNREALVFRALDSVARQTCPPLEVIVVDDCSTDCTVEAVRAAKFPFPVHVVSLATNQGPGAARNAGILKAAGRYIAFLDSDDTWLPDKLERQVALLDSLPGRDVTVLYGQVRLQRHYEVLVRPTRPKGTGESFAEYVFANGGYLDQNTVMMPAALARAVMYRADMRLHEDWDFYMRLEERGAAFVMLDGPVGITCDNSTAGRASAAQPVRSLALLEEWRPRISRRAYFGLRARIAPQLRGHATLRACWYILDGFRHGAISPWMLLVLTGRLVHPDLRQLAYYIRGRLVRNTAAGAR